jgi:hypothetical protein
MISVHFIKVIKESYIKPQKNKEIVYIKNWCGLGLMRKSCKLIRCRISLSRPDTQQLRAFLSTQSYYRTCYNYYQLNSHNTHTTKIGE